MKRAESRTGRHDARRRAGPRAAPAAATVPAASFAPAPLRALHVAALAVILTAAALIYAPTTNRPFFADDYLFLDQVRDRPLLTALVSVDPLSNFYRPVSRQLYFWLVGHASNESERAFHFTSIVLFLVLLVLLFGVVRRLAGNRAGLIATGFLALSYAPDVAVRWACGSQELLAVIGALAGIWLHVKGHRLWAAVAMLLAALSKEVILLAPVVAVLADRRPSESWKDTIRRGWPLAVAVGVWVAMWAMMPHRRAQQATEVELDPTGPIATLWHLVQVTLGLEWRRGDFGRLPRVLPPLVPLVLVLAGVLGTALWRRHAPKPGGETAPTDAEASQAKTRLPSHARLRAAIRTGLVWAVVGAAPVAAVAILWSAYYYLFALCGVGLVLGALLTRRHWGWTVAALVVLAWGSASARHLQEFATPRSPWTGQSHINAFYMDRSARVVDRYLSDIRKAHPTFPEGSTVFYAGLKGNVAFQVANGPLLRWAYRDTSLRSYYLYDFSRARAARGSTYFFVGEGDSLRQLPDSADLYSQLALGMMASDQPQQARDALAMQLQRTPDDRQVRAWLGWTELAMGRRDEAIATLRRAGLRPAGPSDTSAAGRRAALAALAHGDTTEAFAIARELATRFALDPGARGLLADLLLIRDRDSVEGIVEAFATKALAPRDPFAWRRWGMVQLYRKRHLQALGSFEEYMKLGGAVAAGDTEAKRWIASIRKALPGGVIAPGEREE